MATSRIILIPLVQEVSLVTDQVAPAQSVLDLDVPRFRELLPHAEGLTLHALMTTRTAQFEWNLVLVPGFDRDHEKTPVVIGPTPGWIAVAGPDRFAEYTTTSNFLLHGRLQIAYRVAAGGAGTHSGLVSAVLAVRTFGM